MTFLQTLPALVALIMLAAHFLRVGNLPLLTFFLLMPWLLLIKRRWAAVTVQVALLLGVLLWIYLAWGLIDFRRTLGREWVRLALILGAVALWTAGSALLFFTRRLRRRYRARDRDEASKANG